MASISKRDRLASFSAFVGATSLMERCPRRPSLIVLNYHRLGDGTKCPYDSDVFSATADQFEQQVRYLKTKYRVASLAEAQDFIERPSNQLPQVLITFDDGYLDNFELAFPILRKHGVPATFFLPTSFIGTDRLS